MFFSHQLMVLGGPTQDPVCEWTVVISIVLKFLVLKEGYITLRQLLWIG